MAKTDTNTVHCRGCGDALSPSDDRLIRVSHGRISAMEDGLVDFDEAIRKAWGYMHEHRFLLAVGDPASIDAFADHEARVSAGEALNSALGATGTDG